MSNNRILFSNNTVCPYSCEYCFAKFGCYNKDIMPKLQEIEDIGIDDSIAYFSCDSEIFFNKSDYNRVLEISKSANNLIIDFSTKKNLSDTELEKLSNINSNLLNNNGFLKVSVSVTNKYQIDRIESGTSSYSNRLRTFHELLNRDILTSINLKPLLPFIAVEEYLEIIEDFYFGSSSVFLIGDLYIDPNDVFGQRIIKENPKLINERKVSWLPEQPTWLVCEDVAKKQIIKDMIILKDANYFETDIDVVKHFSRILNKKLG